MAALNCIWNCVGVRLLTRSLTPSTFRSQLGSYQNPKTPKPPNPAAASPPQGTLLAPPAADRDTDVIVAINRMPIDPDVGIPDLIHRLTDDSKRLLNNEVRLAKLELRDAVHQAGRGAMWLGVGFGVGVVALVAFTLFLVTLIGRIAAGHVWIGAVVTGVLELGVALTLFRRGKRAFTEPSYTLPETRQALTGTVNWASTIRD